MSHVTPSDASVPDLGRHRGGRRWGGGGRRWGGGGWYGGYPWYNTPIYSSPLVVMDPVDPQSEADIKKAKEAEAKLKELAEKEKIKAIAAAVREELAKGKGLAQYGTYIDVMGPGARDTEIDVEAADNEVIDEKISARDALLWRQQQGLVGLGDTTPAAPSFVGRLLGGCAVAAGVSILAGAAVGYMIGSRKAS